MNKQKFLFACFTEDEILLEQGRLLFSLLNAFSSENYQIRLYNNLPVDRLGKYANLVFSLNNLRTTDTPPKNTENCVYLFDKAIRKFGKLPWHRKVMVRFDIFSPYWLRKPVIMPFPVHPLHNTPDLGKRLIAHRLTRKNMKVFFSGDTKGYTKNHIRYPKGKLPRLTVINTILDSMGEDAFLVDNQSDLNKLRMARYTNKCVIIDTNRIWVESRDWLSDIARADFFLCPPGIVMPMCHNLIEAMAVGAIPITNYPEWLDPQLEHMETCIAFDNREDLIKKLSQAMHMNKEKLTTMRKNVIDYYESYLKSEFFIHKLETSNVKTIPLLMYLERNAARNSKKLNRYSILIQGTSFADDNKWLQLLPQRLLGRL